MTEGSKAPSAELSLNDEVKLLREMYSRERAARQEAEQIGEEATLRMGLIIQELSETNEKLHDAVAEAQEASRTKGQFLANMSHEIRTPMNGVLGMVDLLFHTELTSRQRRFAETIRSSAEALLVVLNDVLDFSKLEVGKVSLHLMDFDLRALLEDVLEMAAVRGQGKGLEIGSLVFHKVPSRVRGAPDRIRQVLGNLLTNAVKFTERGEVTLRVRLLEEDPTTVLLRFEVTDSGAGIHPDDLRRLFQPFTQVDGSHTRKHGGTGLGLAISKQIVELMGGSIGADSEPGQGSVFWFTVRLERGVSLGASTPAGPLEPMNLRVLIVDDNGTNRAILQGLLEARGGRADCADRGAAGLTMALDAASRGENYNVALVDGQMPDADGWTTAMRFKAHPESAAIPLIMLTSLAQAGDGNRALDVGFSGYLTKPVRERLLLKCIAEVTGNLTRGAPSPGAPPLVTRHTLAERRAQSRARILVVEDNPINQLVTSAMLEHLGYQVDVAEDGLEALEAVSRARYALVLMDCQMPNMDGFSATAEIRRREGSGPHVPIIALTAHAMVGDRERVISAGMNDYLSKPVRVEGLGAVIRQWMTQAPDDAPTELGSEPPRALIHLQLEHPEIAREVVRLFLEHTPLQLQGLRRHFEVRDAEGLSRLAHTLKGSCLTLGADPMVKVCSSVQVACDEADFIALGPLLGELDREFEALCAVLTSPSQAPGAL